MELKYIVYVTVNLCNGKLYFGVHKTNPEVFDGYIGNSIYRLAQASLDTPFHKAVRKYGYENFKRVTIAIFPLTEEGKLLAFELEKLIVNPVLLKSKNIYNIVIGGLGGDLELLRKTVYQFSLDGNFIRSYKSAREAAISIDPENLDKILQAIKSNCIGHSYSSYGYYWSYFKEFISKEDYSQNIKRRNNKIALYTIGGKFLRYFDNISEARSETGLLNIYYAIKNNASVGGFLWRWYTDDLDIKPIENGVTVFRHKPIIVTFENGITKEYDSIKQCIELNPIFSSKGIKNVLRGINKTHLKCKFRWKDDDIA